MIRVLHIFNSMANGGTEHFVMNNYRRIDRSEVEFDFLTSVDEPGYFDEEIRSLGGRIFHACPIQQDPIRNYLDIKRIVRENGYTIVHRHTGSAIAYWDLRAARAGGAKVLIMHAHSPQAGKPIVHSLANFFLKLDCVRLACSDKAGRWLHGNKSFTVIPNAIDCSEYKYDSVKRDAYRKELGLDDEIVVGHIGSFQKIKNHTFLIEVFAEICKQHDNYKLLLVGEGPLLNDMKTIVHALGLDGKVIFLGSRTDVKDLINAFDVFVLPSQFEGFPFTLVEAQANGLACVVSAEALPECADLIGKMKYVSLNESKETWVETITKAINKRRQDADMIVAQKGYDINASSSNLVNLYKSLYNQNI